MPITRSQRSVFHLLLQLPKALSGKFPRARKEWLLSRVKETYFPPSDAAKTKITSTFSIVHGAITWQIYHSSGRGEEYFANINGLCGAFTFVNRFFAGKGFT